MSGIGHSGWTLVDVVAQIWSLPGSVVDSVESVANDVFEGIKMGIEYISNTVMNAIMDAFVEGYKLSLISIGHTLKTLLGGSLNIIILSNGIQIEGTTIKIVKENLNMILQLNQTKLNLGSPISAGPIEIETLSGLTVSASTQQTAITALKFSNFLLTLATKVPAIAEFAAFGILMSSFSIALLSILSILDAFDENIDAQEREDYRIDMGIFHFLALLGHAGPRLAKKVGQAFASNVFEQKWVYTKGVMEINLVDTFLITAFPTLTSLFGYVLVYIIANGLSTKQSGAFFFGLFEFLITDRMTGAQEKIFDYLEYFYIILHLVMTVVLFAKSFV